MADEFVPSLYVELAQLNKDTLRVYTGIEDKSIVVRWLHTDIPTKLLIGDACQTAFVTACQALWPDTRFGTLLGLMAHQKYMARFAAEDRLSPEFQGISAHAMMSIAVSGEQERQSFLVLGFVGALIAYVVGKDALPQSDLIRIITLGLVGASLVAGLWAFWIGQALAAARVGQQMTEKLEAVMLSGQLNGPGEIFEALDHALDRQRALLWKIDRHYIDPVCDKSKSLQERLMEGCRRLGAATVRHSKLIRIQLVTAAAAASLIFVGALFAPAKDDGVKASATNAPVFQSPPSPPGATAPALPAVAPPAMPAPATTPNTTAPQPILPAPTTPVVVTPAQPTHPTKQPDDPPPP